MHKLIKQAFTLIELLVVIAIIGILSGLIIVGMSSMTQKATIAKAQVFSSSLRNSLIMNLISEWKFNEGSGTAISDSWGGGNSGTLSCVGASCWKSGKDCLDGSCLSFNSADGNDAVIVNSNVNLNNPTQTIEAWINPSIWNSVTGTVLRRAEGTNQDWYYVFYGGGGGATANTAYSLVYYTNTSAVDSNYVYPFKLISIEKWSHFVLTLTSDGNAIFYINGVWADTRSATNFSHWGRANALTSTVNVVIGSRSAYIDGIRIYNSAISASRVKEQYYAGLNSLLNNGQINTKEYSQRIDSIAKE